MAPGDIREYTVELNQHYDDLMQKFTEEARNNRVPIMQPESMALVEQFIRAKKPAKILEIGTAVGWSAINMALAADSQIKIITVERDPFMVSAARKNITDFHLEQAIEIVSGDVLELRKELETKAPFDMILIDAGKGHYEEYFTAFIPMLARDGLVICDNVYFRGFVINPDEAPKRLRRLAQKMNQFNLWLSQHPDFDTRFVPVGDGLSISTKKVSAQDRKDF